MLDARNMSVSNRLAQFDAQQWKALLQQKLLATVLVKPTDAQLNPTTSSGAVTVVEQQERSYRRGLLVEAHGLFSAIFQSAWEFRDRVELEHTFLIDRFWVEQDEALKRSLLRHEHHDGVAACILLMMLQDECSAEGAERELIAIEEANEFERFAVEERRMGVESISKIEGKAEKEVIAPKPPQKHMQPQPPKPSLAQRPSRDLCAFVSAIEQKERDAIVGCWHQELGDLASSLAQLNEFCAVGCARYAIEVEAAALRVQMTKEFFAMLLEACEKLEFIARLDVARKHMPKAMSQLRYEERQAWLMARREEVARFTNEELDAAESDDKMRTAVFEFSRGRLMARVGVERAERAARSDMLKEERDNWRIIQQMFEAPMARLIEAQVAYEIDMERVATTVRWNESSYRTIYLGETFHRASVESDEKEARLMLRSAEVTCYLASTKVMLINKKVSDELAAIDFYYQPEEVERGD